MLLGRKTEIVHALKELGFNFYMDSSDALDSGRPISDEILIARAEVALKRLEPLYQTLQEAITQERGIHREGQSRKMARAEERGT